MFFRLIILGFQPFRSRALGLSKGIEDMGTLKWDLALCLLLAWIIVYVCICRGIKSTGKVNLAEIMFLFDISFHTFLPLFMQYYAIFMLILVLNLLFVLCFLLHCNIVSVLCQIRE